MLSGEDIEGFGAESSDFCGFSFGDVKKQIPSMVEHRIAMTVIQSVGFL